MIVDVLAYIADAWILGTYGLMAWHPRRARWFHLANAIGCAPILAIEVAASAWPALVLTAAFGGLGWFGLWKSLR